MARITVVLLVALLATPCVTSFASAADAAKAASLPVTGAAVDPDAHLKGALGCTLCKLLAGTIRSVLQAKPTVQCVSWLLRADLMYIAAEGYANNDMICGALLKMCPYTPKDTHWTLPLDGNKPAVKPWTTQPVGSPTLTILHLSDIHVDVEYTPGAESRCGEPLCCRASSPGKGNNGSANYGAGEWGMGPGFECDLPMKTLHNAFAHIATMHKPDLILFTGDIESHNIWTYRKQENLELIYNMTELFLEYFPDTKIISAIGNHETVPCNDIAERGVPAQFSHDWLYKALHEAWMHWLPADTSASILWRASYVITPYKGLRIVSLNTIYAYKDNFFLFISDKDPDGTLSWLIAQLAEAESVGDKVWIIGHVPSGSTDARAAWSRNFYNIVNRYESTIRGQFYGHTHDDEFAVFYNDFMQSNGNSRQTPSNFYFVTPSLTTFDSGDGVNPAYRIYTVQGEYADSDYSVIDAKTYSMDVARANMPGNEPVWVMEYDTRTSYDMKALHPQDWHDLIVRMSDDNSYVDKFFESVFDPLIVCITGVPSHYYRTNVGRNCDATCVNQTTCMLGSAYSPITMDCKKPASADDEVVYTEEVLTKMMRLVDEFRSKVDKAGICQF